MGGWKWPKKQKDAKSPRELLDLNQLARWGNEVYVKKLCGQIDYSGSNAEDGVKGDKIGRKKAGYEAVITVLQEIKGPDIMKYKL